MTKSARVTRYEHMKLELLFRFVSTWFRYFMPSKNMVFISLKVTVSECEGSSYDAYSWYFNIFFPGISMFSENHSSNFSIFCSNSG